MLEDLYETKMKWALLIIVDIFGDSAILVLKTITLNTKTRHSWHSLLKITAETHRNSAEKPRASCVSMCMGSEHSFVASIAYIVFHYTPRPDPDQDHHQSQRPKPAHQTQTAVIRTPSVYTKTLSAIWTHTRKCIPPMICCALEAN